MNAPFEDAAALGERIRRRRKLLRMTQEDLAGSNFSRSYICQVEKGRIRPSLNALESIAARLGISPAELFPGTPLPDGGWQAAHPLRIAAISNLLAGDYKKAIALFTRAMAKAQAKSPGEGIHLEPGQEIFLAECRLFMAVALMFEGRFGHAARVLEDGTDE
ncbi:MAG: helix-turn-helix domain-containing protein [Firmicutes bacterium]|nr:helix-turn-helix domain-containing protein [Bacillota bacterium]